MEEGRESGKKSVRCVPAKGPVHKLGRSCILGKSPHAHVQELFGQESLPMAIHRLGQCLLHCFAQHHLCQILCGIRVNLPTYL